MQGAIAGVEPITTCNRDLFFVVLCFAAESPTANLVVFSIAATHWRGSKIQTFCLFFFVQLLYHTIFI